VSKTVAAVLAALCLSLFSLPMSAQLIPHGNVYVGGSLERAEILIPNNKFTSRGWNASGEAIPFSRYTHLGFVLDGSGFYRPGITQYNLLFGPRYSFTVGKLRPFVHFMAGAQRLVSTGTQYDHLALDAGGGLDYKLFFKNFSWRIQGDYVHTHFLSNTQVGYRGSTGIVWRF
jgi:hypothetical protein